MNPVELYIATCRYIVKLNPNDPDTWAELRRFIPFLRQALSCCVCTKIFHRPMGPEQSKCYHHVCKDCVGGKMKMKPVCGWCNDFSVFKEKPELRIVVQCYKKLCDYVASSSIMYELSDNINSVASTSSSTQLYNLIEEALTIRDDEYDSFVNREILCLPGLSKMTIPPSNQFPPLLQKMEKVDKTSIDCKSNIHIDSSLHKEKSGKIISKLSDSSKGKNSGKGSKGKRTRKISQKSISSDYSDVSTGKTTSLEPHLKRTLHVEQEENQTDYSMPTASKIGGKKSKKNKRHPVKLVPKLKIVKQRDNMKAIKVTENEINLKLSETVKAEHDYIKETPDQNLSVKSTKWRLRHSSPASDESNEINGYLLESKSYKSDNIENNGNRRNKSHHVTVINSNSKKYANKLAKLNNSQQKHGNKVHWESRNNNNSVLTHNNMKVKNTKVIASHTSANYRSSSSKAARHYGCRCGLATPKPGSLTCCGQRCPCYSSYKGCVACKCRGCRNPRGDPAYRLKHQNLLANSASVSTAPQSRNRVSVLDGLGDEGLHTGGATSLLLPLSLGEKSSLYTDDEGDDLEVEIDI